MAASVLERAGETVGEYLPRFGGALAVLLVGLVLVRFLGRGVAGLLIRLGADRLAERAGVHDVLARAGLERSLSRLIAFAIRIALAVAVVLAAVSLLGLQPLDRALNEGILFLPRLLAALALVLVGAVLGSLARERLERVAYQMDLRGPLGPAAQWAVASVFAIVALGQIGVPTAVLTVLAGIIAAGAALTVALAFGLGSSDLAREVSAGRYVSASFEVGQEVTVGEHRGQIAAIETASTVLEREDGDSVRIPNHRFLLVDVILHRADAASADPT